MMVISYRNPQSVIILDMLLFTPKKDAKKRLENK
jgi:hypothetical protein